MVSARPGSAPCWDDTYHHCRWPGSLGDDEQQMAHAFGVGVVFQRCVVGDPSHSKQARPWDRQQTLK